MRQELQDDLFFAQFEEWVVHWAIVAEVEQVSSAVFGWRAIVGMLDQAGEGIAGVAGIDPVAIGHLAIQRENETLRAVRLPPVVSLAVIFGQRGYEAAGEARCHRRDDA